MRRRLTWLRGSRKLYALGIALDTALISVLLSASVATPVAASTTQTVTVWQPLACLILGAIPSHIGVALKATIPTSVTPGQQFNMTDVTAVQTLTVAAQLAAVAFHANAFEGVVKDFENKLTGATFTLAGGAPTTQFNQVAALQPPNSDQQGNTPPADPNIDLLEGPSPLAAWADQSPPVAVGAAVRQNVFSFGPIPVNSLTPSANTYGPAPGTGGGPLVSSGTADPLRVIGPFTATGAAGTNLVIGNGDASRTVNVEGQTEVLVAQTTIFFFDPTPVLPTYPTGRWSIPISADCGIDTHPTKIVGTPDPSFLANFTIPIVAAATAPAVTTQPADQTVNAGATASFTSHASGSPAPTVQWQVQAGGVGAFTDLSGATSDTLSVPTTDTSLSGNKYQAVFSNGTSPDATSNVATLTVNPAPVAPAVTAQPGNQTVTAGASASFTSTASGTPAPTVQWQVQPGGVGAFSNIAGETSTTLTVATTDTSKNGNKYHAVFSNGTLPNATSNAATLTVNAAPVAPAVTAQPADQTIKAGASASFTSTASGSPAPTVQWQVQSGGVGAFTDLAGEISTTLTVPTTDTSLSGNKYQAVFSNGTLPDATSNAATLTVNPATVAPAVTTDPSNQTVTAGATASFTSHASGSPAPTVQWHVQTGGVGAFNVLAGATFDTLAVATTDTSLSGNKYRAVFSNGTLPNATSAAATLTVNAAPSAPALTTQPTNQSVNAGTIASFTSHASGNPAPTVQWQVQAGGVGAFIDLTGATSDTLTVPTVDTSKNGNRYHAVFSNGNLPDATSNAATLAVGAATSAPVVANQPVNQAVTAGGPATFTASASGNPTPTVQWQVSTTEGGAFSNVAGATSTTFTITKTTVAMSGYQYRAVFTNSAGTATTAAATLSASVAAASTQPTLPNSGTAILEQGRLAIWPAALLLLALLGTRSVVLRRRRAR